MGMRHEFRFVLDGVELSEEAQERIASAVAEAGSLELARLSSAAESRERGSATGGSFFSINPEWYGRWVILLEAGAVPGLVAQVGGSPGKIG